MKLKNKTYNLLKFVTTIFIPAFITLLGSVGIALGYVEETKTVATVLTAIDTFLCALIGLSSDSYKYDDILKEKAPMTTPVVPQGEDTTYTLESLED